MPSDEVAEMDFVSFLVTLKWELERSLHLYSRYWFLNLRSRVFQHFDLLKFTFLNCQGSSGQAFLLISHTSSNLIFHEICDQTRIFCDN